MTKHRRFSVNLALASLLTGALGLGVIACGSDDSSGSAGTGGVATGGAAGALTGGSGGAVTGGSGGALTGGSGGTVTGGAGGLAGAAGSGGLAAEYPAGPYGNEVGDTIANLAWEGYVNETGAASSDTLPYVDYGTDAMRKSGKAYGLIHISAFT